MSLLLLSKGRPPATGPDRLREEELVLLAAASGHDVVIVPHLYDLADEAEVWTRLAATATATTAVCAWMQPRATEILLRQHRLWSNQHRAWNLGSGEATDLWQAIAPSLGAGAGGTTHVYSTPTAPRWHPVIDLDRCTHCGQCQQFCLFGVYELDDAGRLVVAKPDQCKPGCPACARVCPHSAIVFPLYDRDPAISGAPGHLVPEAAATAAWQERNACTRSAAGVDGLDALIADLDSRQRQGKPRG